MNERAAVLGRRLFDSVDSSAAADVAWGYMTYYEEQRQAGVSIDNRAFDPMYEQQLRAGYLFHPEFVRLLSERLAGHSGSRRHAGALRLVARTLRATWERRAQLGPTPLLQPQHVDLRRGELRDEVLGRLGRTAFERGLDPTWRGRRGARTPATSKPGWPWPAASEAALVTFLHSPPDGSRGVTPSEVAPAIGRPP